MSRQDTGATDQTPASALFLCTGNSCRSQMAEGWARVLLGESIEIYSAGIEPKGLDPRAVRRVGPGDTCGESDDGKECEHVSYSSEHHPNQPRERGIVSWTFNRNMPGGCNT